MGARGRRFVSAAAAVVVVCSAAPPAVAAPSPRDDEWWFKAWSVQEKVWPLSRGAGVTVAVIDTGVNARLPELAGVVLRGLDTTGGSSAGQVDFDPQGHGTSVAAQIAGQGGGTTGYAGLAPEVRILPVRLPATSGAGKVPEIARGIRFAADHGAKVINLSFGGPSLRCADELQKAIGYAIERDAVLVASAGNSGHEDNLPEEPARCPGVLAVGAVTKATRPWPHTQRQNYVTLAAPGAQLGLVGKDGGYSTGNAGTSGSAALTSAAVALVRSRNPTMSGRTVVQRLIATALPVGEEKWNPQTGFGVVLVRGAMDPAGHPVPAAAPNPVYEAFDKWKASASRAPSAPASPAAALPKRARRSDGPSAIVVVTTAAAGALVLTGCAVGLLMLSRRRRPARPI